MQRFQPRDRQGQNRDMSQTCPQDAGTDRDTTLKGCPVLSRPRLGFSPLFEPTGYVRAMRGAPWSTNAWPAVSADALIRYQRPQGRARLLSGCDARGTAAPATGRHGKPCRFGTPRQWGRHSAVTRSNRILDDRPMPTPGGTPPGYPKTSAATESVGHRRSHTERFSRDRNFLKETHMRAGHG